MPQGYEGMGCSWGSLKGHGSALPSPIQTVPLSPGKNKFPVAVGVSRACSLPLVFFLTPPPSPLTQQVDNQPPRPCVEDSLLKRRARVFTRKCQPPCLLSLYASPHTQQNLPPHWHQDLQAHPRHHTHVAPLQPSTSSHGVVLETAHHLASNAMPFHKGTCFQTY